MPREIVVIQCGQCGNQVGCRFWDLALQEHASCNPSATFDHALSSFFRNVDVRYDPPRELCVGSGCSPIRFLKARAVLIDMEEGVINQLLKGPLSDLFQSKQYIAGVSGSGNNWAYGHEVYGPQYEESILEKVRHEVEPCESLQSFFMLHSLGGGTGSGLGSYIMELLNDVYPEVYRICTSIFPSKHDDVVTSPYNRKEDSPYEYTIYWQLFSEVLSQKNQLIKVNPVGSTYLACALLMRSRKCNISDINHNIIRMKQRINMVHWNGDGFKIGICEQPPLHSPSSLLCLANNTCIRYRFMAMKERFQKLYKRKVYLHHYTQHMDVGMFDSSLGLIEDLIEEYALHESSKSVKDPPK